jgi:argininosuccinate lyase
MSAAARFNTARMEAACGGGFLEATDAAEYLVKKGLPFRKAHEAVAMIVRDCIAAGQRGITERSLEELQKHSALFEGDVYGFLLPRAGAEARNLPGGPAPAEVRRQIGVLREKLGKGALGAGA